MYNNYHIMCLYAVHFSMYMSPPMLTHPKTLGNNILCSVHNMYLT